MKSYFGDGDKVVLGVALRGNECVVRALHS